MMSSQSIDIGGRQVGPGHPVFIVAEMSANHGNNFDTAVQIMRAAKDAGADAVKMQTYTPDTLTIDCDNAWFKIKGTLWEGQTLYELYGTAYTPWEWHEPLKEIAAELDLVLFSTPFDSTALAYLEELNFPAHKIASFELVDIPLIEEVAATGKPVIMSVGMASLDEIQDAVDAFYGAGGTELILLKCTSAYPAPYEEVNLQTIPDMASSFKIPIGLSDHTKGGVVPVAAVALGACLVEKHFTLSRANGGPDSAFSLEPDEFRTMVEGIRTAEKALGTICYDITDRQKESMVFRRSLFVVKDIKKGQCLTAENIRSIRPGYGLAPKYYSQLLGRKVVKDLVRGTPLAWESLES